MPNTRSQDDPLYIQINDIERYLRLRRHIQEYHLLHNTQPHQSLESPAPQPTEEMVANPAPRPLKYYAIPSQDEPHNSIAAPPIEANNFRHLRIATRRRSKLGETAQRQRCSA